MKRAFLRMSEPQHYGSPGGTRLVRIKWVGPTTSCSHRSTSISLSTCSSSLAFQWISHVLWLDKHCEPLRLNSTRSSSCQHDEPTTAEGEYKGLSSAIYNMNTLVQRLQQHVHVVSWLSCMKRWRRLQAASSPTMTRNQLMDQIEWKPPQENFLLKTFKGKRERKETKDTKEQTQKYQVFVVFFFCFLDTTIYM